MTRLRRLFCRVLGHQRKFVSHQAAMDWLWYGATDGLRCRRCGQ